MKKKKKKPLKVKRKKSKKTLIRRFKNKRKKIRNKKIRKKKKSNKQAKKRTRRKVKVKIKRNLKLKSTKLNTQKTRAIVSSLLRLSDKFKSIFRFNLNLDRTLRHSLSICQIKSQELKKLF